MLIKRLGCCLYGRSLRYFFHQFTNHIKLNICLKLSSSASVLRDSTSECIQISWGILLQYSTSCGCHSFLHFHIFCIHLPWHNYSFQTKEHHTQDWYGTFVIIEVNGLVLISITIYFQGIIWICIWEWWMWFLVGIWQANSLNWIRFSIESPKSIEK